MQTKNKTKKTRLKLEKKKEARMNTLMQKSS